MPTITKDQFRNDSGGVAGAIVLDGTGQKSIAVLPGDTVWLTEDEQALTANAPRREEDNPFINGTFSLIAEGKNIKHARPLRPVTIEDPIVLGTEVGAPPVATGEPAEGSRPAGEEVATPQAVEPETEVAADGRTVVKKRPAAPAKKA